MKTEKRIEIFGGDGIIEEEYNLETGEITFQGKIKIDRSKKKGKKIFYYSLIDKTPVITYFINREPYNKSGATKEKADELVKQRYGIDMNE